MVIVMKTNYHIKLTINTKAGNKYLEKSKICIAKCKLYIEYTQNITYYF